MSETGCWICYSQGCPGCLGSHNRGRLPDEAYQCHVCKERFFRRIFLDGLFEDGDGYKTICLGCKESRREPRSEA